MVSKQSIIETQADLLKAFKDQFSNTHEYYSQKVKHLESQIESLKACSCPRRYPEKDENLGQVKTQLEAKHGVIPPKDFDRMLTNFIEEQPSFVLTIPEIKKVVSSYFYQTISQRWRWSRGQMVNDSDIMKGDPGGKK